MPDLSRVELVIAVNNSLDRADVGHGFGGAIALAYYVGEPRATRDLDINVTAPVDHARMVFEVLADVVTWTEDDVCRCARDGQVRLWHGPHPTGTPVDLFFPQHRLHSELAQAITRRPFAQPDYTIPVIAAAHLAVFKLLYGRTRDWADIEAMLEYRSFDPLVVMRWLADLLGEDHPTWRRFVELAQRASEPSECEGRREMPEPIIDWSVLDRR